MTGQDGPLPDSVVAIVGLPRSGTTLIHRMVAAHPTILGISEPYQRRRSDGYDETHPARLAEDHDALIERDTVICVKETLTRPDNANHVLELLERSRTLEIYTSLIVVLRSPFESFLSQVEASRTMWHQKLLPDDSSDSFERYARVVTRGLRILIDSFGRQHLRIVRYGDFCSDPTNELARLLGVIPLRIDPSQLSLATSSPGPGDPRAHRSSTIERKDRSHEVAMLRRRLGDGPYAGLFGELHELAESSRARLPDRELADAMTLAIVGVRET